MIRLLIVFEKWLHSWKSGYRSVDYEVEEEDFKN